MPNDYVMQCASVCMCVYMGMWVRVRVTGRAGARQHMSENGIMQSVYMCVYVSTLGRGRGLRVNPPARVNPFSRASSGGLTR